MEEKKEGEETWALWRRPPFLKAKLAHTNSSSACHFLSLALDN